MSDRRQRQKEQRAAKRKTEKKQEARKELRRRLATALGFGIVVVTIGNIDPVVVVGATTTGLTVTGGASVVLAVRCVLIEPLSI